MKPSRRPGRLATVGENMGHVGCFRAACFYRQRHVVESYACLHRRFHLQGARPLVLRRRRNVGKTIAVAVEMPWRGQTPASYSKHSSNLSRYIFRHEPVPSLPPNCWLRTAAPVIPRRRPMAGGLFCKIKSGENEAWHAEWRRHAIRIGREVKRVPHIVGDALYLPR